MYDNDEDFPRFAYLSLADEWASWGQTFPDRAPKTSDFDWQYVEAARFFAEALSLPMPWEVGGVDEARRLVKRALGMAR